jgi:hypothetical protein
MKIKKIDIFAEWSDQKVLAGVLEFFDGEYILTYNQEWIDHEQSISLTEGTPLSSKIHRTTNLWGGVEDRLPPISSKTYSNLCKGWGVPTGEQDILLLLATVGHRAMGCFVFYGPDELYY